MLRFLDEDSSWVGPDPVQTRSYRCGFCDQRVASDRGFRIDRRGEGQVGGVYVCPGCGGPTFFAPDGRQFPHFSVGHSVEHVPTALSELYEEARRSVSHQCYTGASLLCQKILRHMAITRGAPEEAGFFDCIIFLEEEDYIPPDGSHWVDHIGQKNRQASRRLRVRSGEDAEDLLRFTEMLLRFNYEFPNLIAGSGAGFGRGSTSGSRTEGRSGSRTEARSGSRTGARIGRRGSDRASDEYPPEDGNGSISRSSDPEIEVGRGGSGSDGGAPTGSSPG